MIGVSVAMSIASACGMFWSAWANDRALQRTLFAHQRLAYVTDLRLQLSSYAKAVLASAAAKGADETRMTTRRHLDTVLAKGMGRHFGAAGVPAERFDPTSLAALGALQAGIKTLDRALAESAAEEFVSVRAAAVRDAVLSFDLQCGSILSAVVDQERERLRAALKRAATVAWQLNVAGLAGFLLVLACVIPLQLLVVAPLLRRLVALKEGLRRLDRGFSGLQLPVVRPDELGLMAASINRMAARLARRNLLLEKTRAGLEDAVALRTRELHETNLHLVTIDANRRRFFCDLSHELRTPLTVIIGECEIVMRTARQMPESCRAAFGTIGQRAARLKHCVEKLLRLAQSESGLIDIDLRQTNVGQVLEAAIETFALPAQRRAILLSNPVIGQPICIMADRDWLRQIVEILLDNALRHAIGAKRITVEGFVDGDCVAIAVTDDGIGFPDQPERLVARFARARRARGSLGFGIGLDLARAIAERHGGGICLGSGDGGRGARVVIRLPLHCKELPA